MRIFSIILLILVGVVFITGPVKILSNLTTVFMSTTFWVFVILCYHNLASMLSIDKLIGKIFPVFGFAFFYMAIGLITALIVKGFQIPELSSENNKNFHYNSKSFPIFPMLFITIACGAISGFHATQSPLMARCNRNEKNGRFVVYGAMIAEGIAALISAAIAMSFLIGVRELNNQMQYSQGNAPVIVKVISSTLLGTFWGIFALIGIVGAPINSGDTALRSAWLTNGDFFKKNQVPVKIRLLITIPIFFVAVIFTTIDLSTIWRYFAWSNLTLAMIFLWGTMGYLFQSKKPYSFMLTPVAFMTSVIFSYILLAPEGFP